MIFTRRRLITHTSRGVNLMRKSFLRRNTSGRLFLYRQRLEARTSHHGSQSNAAMLRPNPVPLALLLNPPCIARFTPLGIHPRTVVGHRQLKLAIISRYRNEEAGRSSFQRILKEILKHPHQFIF